MYEQSSTIPPIDELISLYNQNIPMSKLAKQFGASEATIRNRLKAAGCELRSRGGPRDQSSRKPALPWDEIIGKYQRGVSGETIAAEYKVGANTIYRGLVEHNIEVRERTAHMKDLWAERNAQLKFARQYPPDWFEKSLDSRIIGDPLLQGPMSNLELAERLLRGKLVNLADYGQTAREISRHRAFVKRVNEIRNWLGRPGEVRGEVTK